MSRKRIFISLAACAAIAAGWCWYARTPAQAPLASPSPTVLSEPAASVVATIEPAATPSQAVDQPVALIGEIMLSDYASESRRPEHDLILMAQLMENFTLLVKSAAYRPMSDNEAWAAAFRGRNPAHQRFLPDEHRALNAEGQLVDRWGTPLFIHSLGGQRFEIRSAGPDRQLWTADDIQRNSDGSFRTGGHLDEPAQPSGQARTMHNPVAAKL